VNPSSSGGNYQRVYLKTDPSNSEGGEKGKFLVKGKVQRTEKKALDLLKGAALCLNAMRPKKHFKEAADTFVLNRGAGKSSVPKRRPALEGGRAQM